MDELQAIMKKELEKLYPHREAASMVRILFQHITGKTAAALVLEKERKCSESEIFFLQNALKRLQQHEPLQYITGQAYFRDLVLQVNKSVLIPRPETEELVQWVVDSLQACEKKVDILDIGTGSGCIAISLSRELAQAKVTAIDISEKALALARENAKDAQSEVSFLRHDILDKDAGHSLPVYDVIVSNPPYVTPADRLLMNKNVSGYEPSLALFVEDDDPLVFYREIIHFSVDHLKSGGHIFFECNESNANEVVELLNNHGFNDISLRKDMQGKDRMVKGIK